jgi:hypothetical protein
MIDTAMTPPAVARKLGVKPQKVLTFIATGELKAINLAERRGGRPRWKVLPEALEQFLQSRSSSPPAPEPVRRRRREVGKKRYYRR